MAGLEEILSPNLSQVGQTKDIHESLCVLKLSFAFRAAAKQICTNVFVAWVGVQYMR